MENNEPMTPWELFGVECEKGWEKLITPLFEYIEKYNKGKPEEEQIIIDQVKEKFAGLRFYVTNPTEKLNLMIRDAEAESYCVCEKCGSTEDVGMLKMGSWYYTRCRKCAQGIVNSFKKPGQFKRGEEIITLEPEEI